MRTNLRVATWNLGQSRLCNMPLVAEALRQSNADIVFLNEVMRGDGWADTKYGVNQVLDLQARCGYAFAQWTDATLLSPIVGSGAKMVGILSRFALTAPVPQPAIEDPPWNGTYRALEVQALIDGQVWLLYTLRFSAYNFPNFSSHCALLRDRILSLPTGSPVIAAGDFNGNAHHWTAWRASARNDPSLVQRMPGPISDLAARAGLASATEAWPLRPADDTSFPGDVLPASVEANDLVLFRGAYDCVQATESRPACGCTDTFGPSIGPDHALVVADLALGARNAVLGVINLLLAQPVAAKKATPVKRAVKPKLKPKPKPKPKPPAKR